MIIRYDIWPTAAAPAEAGWRRVARVAMSRPLCDYIVARILEMISKWMFRFTTPLVVWQLTHDERLLSMALICLLLPGLVMELVGGIVADRYDRKLIIIASCLGTLACNVVIAALSLMGSLTVGWLLGLTLLYGAITAISHAASKTIVTAYVKREELAAAVSLNTIVFHTAGFIGPALAAVLVASISPAAAYLTSALLSLAFALLFWRIPAPETDRTAHHKSFLPALADGFTHVRTVPLLFWIFCLHIGSVALARPFIEFVPAIVHHAFGGGAREAGVMLSAYGAGSICGGLWLASRTAHTSVLTAAALGAMPLFCICLVGILASPNLPVAAALALAAGFFMIVRGGAIQSLIQLESEPAFRGRVVALHGVSFEIGCIAGAFAIGQVAALAGLSVALGAGVALMMGLWLAIRGPIAAEANR